MRKALAAGVVAALFTGPIVVPIAWSQIRTRPAMPTAAQTQGGLVLHGVAINPQMLANRSMLLVDGMPLNPQFAAR